MLIELDETILNSCREIYRLSVHAVSDKLYSPVQKQEWAKFHVSEAFADFVLQGIAIGYIDNRHQLIGFCSATLEGHIKSLYVHPEHQRKGYASKMLNEVMQRIGSVDLLTVDASKISQPVFLKFGFTVTVEEQVKRNGIEITRFKMRRQSNKKQTI